MTKMRIPQGEWIVVCDGGKALVLENVGDEKFPNLRTKEVMEGEHAPAHEVGTDAPGRAMASVGEARSALSDTDWHNQAENQFLRKVMERLDAALAAGQAKSLVIVAPPRALGLIRQLYPQTVRGALRTEIDKDFVKLPVYEIEKHLVG